MDEAGGGAKEAFETVKKLIRKKCYKDASECIKMAMEVYPTADILKENGFGMLIISETLYYGDIFLPNTASRFDFDSYSVLHLPSSSSQAEVKKQFDELREEVLHLKNTRFPGATAALSKLVHANAILCHKTLRSEFDQRRKERVLFDWPISSINTTTTTTSSSSSFRESYLGWKPPVYRVEEHLKSRPPPPLPPPSPPPPPPPPHHNNHGPFVPKEADAAGMSQEFMILKKKLFDEMPQEPHYTPLEKYNSKVREGMIVGLEMAFTILCEEVKKSVDLQSFLCGLDGFNEQISQLKEMGYNVEKVSQRIHILQSIAEEEQASRAAAGKFEVEVRDLEAKVINLQSLISELQDKIQESMDIIANHKTKIEISKKDSSDAFAEFVSTANSKWV